MAVTPADIGWSSYMSNEGPFFIGRQHYVLPPNPTENDHIMDVITAAEGGHYDAINMYDSGIVSVGLIQWIDAGQHSVDNMLGRVADDCGLDKVTGPLADALSQAGAEFKKDSGGSWRFFMAGSEVISNDAERKLFMMGCGPKGSWTDAARLYAKTWAAGLANVWADEGARKAQVDYTVPKLRSFLLADVQHALYDDQPNEGWVGAVRSAMVSFAVNLPAATAAQYRAFAAKVTAPKWSSDWAIGLLKQVTFGSGIGIWPARYNAIRPVLEALYGVSLPKTARDLSSWQPTGANVAPGPVAPPVTSPAPPVSPPMPLISNVPIVALPTVPGESVPERIARIVRSKVGCSLTTRRDELGKLVARGVDKPEAVVTISTNCATSALGFMALMGVKHKLLNTPYQSGMAVSWVRQIGIDLGALVRYTGPNGPQPKPGSLLRYNTAGTNNDHVEWMLGPLTADGSADHAGGGRANNAITEGTGPVLTSWGRPLVEFWDPDKLGIDVAAAGPPAQDPPVDPTPDPPVVVTPPPMVTPPVPPPSPGPIVPVGPTPAWKTLWNFVMMLINLFFKRGA
jgi:hypothetical protein